MALYFLRHGQSEANVAGVFSTRGVRLTELGRSQARAAADKLLPYGITKIVCSTLERSWETACIVAEVLAFDPADIIRDAYLNEYDMGTLTGTSSAGVTAQQLVGAPGAEDPQAFQNRVVAALEEYSKIGGNVLVVSHAGVGCVLEAKRQGVPAAKFYEIPEYANCSIHELRVGS